MLADSVGAVTYVDVFTVTDVTLLETSGAMPLDTILRLLSNTTIPLYPGFPPFAFTANVKVVTAPISDGDVNLDPTNTVVTPVVLDPVVVYPNVNPAACLTG